MKLQFNNVNLSILILFVFFVSCTPKEKSIYQLSTISSLLAGEYDGIRTMKELNQKGDFGIGTFDKLNGEMIVYEGKIYQVLSNGNVIIPDDNTTSPYTSICSFESLNEFQLNELKSLSDLEQKLQSQITNPNFIYAFEITGIFDSIKSRSVPIQQKPYVPLGEAAKQQSVFNYTNQTGVLIGFYSPNTLKDLMVKGLHLHFLSNDKSKGGHLLNISSTQKVNCKMAVFTNIQVDIFQNNSSTIQLRSDEQNKYDIEKIEK